MLSKLVKEILNVSISEWKMNKNTIIHELFKKICIKIHQHENILHKNEKSSRHLSKKWYDTKGKLFFW